MMKAKVFNMSEMIDMLSRIAHNNEEPSAETAEELECKQYVQAYRTVKHWGKYFVALRDLKSVEVCDSILKALLKQIPRAPIKKGITCFCPNCGAEDKFVRYNCIVPYDHCTKCGQALKWPELRVE